jgi:hypothetical protein
VGASPAGRRPPQAFREPHEAVAAKNDMSMLEARECQPEV